MSKHEEHIRKMALEYSEAFIGRGIAENSYIKGATAVMDNLDIDDGKLDAIRKALVNLQYGHLSLDKAKRQILDALTIKEK